VLKEIQKPETLKHSTLSIDDDKDFSSQVSQLETPKTFESLTSLRRSIEMNIAQHEALDARTKLRIRKVVNAAENAFADRAILMDENLLLFEQNNEKNTRTSIKATVVGTAKVLSHEDIVEAQQKRDMKEAEAAAARGRRTSNRNRKAPSQVLGKGYKPYNVLSGGL